MQSGISDQDAHINAADFESTSQLDIREDRGGEGEVRWRSDMDGVMTCRCIGAV